MSHFTVGVIIPNTLEANEIEAKVDALFAPYWEELEAPEYDRKCYCVGKKAERFGEEQAIAKLGTWKTMRDKFHTESHYLELKAAADPDDWDNTSINEYWQEYTKEFNNETRKITFMVAQAQENYQQPDPECDECHGTGFYKSTYNPKSKWDWKVIGGRWDGALIGDRDGNSNAPAHRRDHSLARNSLPLDELVMNAEPYYFFALITPDGEWHEKARMGWFAFTSDDMPQESWEQMSLGIYRKYAAGHDIVLVDAHI